MSTHRLVPFAAMLGIAAACTGCATPFTQAAKAYAGVLPNSTGALSAVPTTASRLCRREAHLSYLQRRLKGESLPAWTDFYAKDQATTTKQSWKDYCAEIDATGPLFTAGVTAISTYGSALSDLAGQGTYANATDISDIATSAGTIASSLGNQTFSTAMAPVGAILSSFASFFVAAYTEHEIHGYVTRADPILQSLLDKLIAYVDALDATLVGIDDTLKNEVENRAEQGMAPAPAAGAKVEAEKLVEFYTFATALDRDAAKARSAVAGYKSVLTQMKAAHTKLVKAASTDALGDAKTAISAVVTLLTQLQKLEGALSQ